MAPRLMMACGVDPTKNFPLDSRPSLSLLLGCAWTRVDPRHTIGPHRFLMNAVWDPRSIKWNQDRGTRAGPAWPRASDGLAAAQTIYTALESAKDLRRTRMDPRHTKGCVSHTTQENNYHARPTLDFPLDSRL